VNPTRFGLPVAAGFAATFLAAALLPGTASAQVSDDIVKIGVLTDMNGPASAPTGQGSVTAAQMAIDDFGGKVLGKPISIVIGDHQLKADIGGGIARRWYDVDQVDLIVDVPVSAVGLAVQNVANEKKRLFITHSTGTADFHGKFCSPYAIQWVFDTRALAVGTADAVVKRGGDSWFFITDDYAFGHSLERDASSVVTANGGKVLGSVKPPLATPDLSSFVLQAQASKAKIIGLATAGGDMINLVKQSSEFGIVKGGQRLAALLAFIADIHTLGLEKAQGMMLTAAFYWDLDDKTRAWSKKFSERYPKVPTMIHAGTYGAVTHYLKAVAASGTDDGGAVVAKMKEMPVDDFMTKGGVIRADGRLVRDMYLFQVKAPSESHGKFDYYKLVATIPGDQAFRPLAAGGCPLVKKN